MAEIVVADKILLVRGLNKVLANTFALYLKTHKFHWYVQGGNEFYGLHVMFEGQYNDLWGAVDLIAERVRQLGKFPPATLTEFSNLSIIPDGSAVTSNQMVGELIEGHQILIDLINSVVDSAQDDQATLNLLTDRLQASDKAHWFLKSSYKEEDSNDDIEIGGES